MNFEEYVKPELLVLIPVLYLIGNAIKKSKIDDRFIPLLLGACGVLMAGIYIVSTESVSGAQQVAAALFTGITQGILAAGASVYVDQLIKQAKKED